MTAEGASIENITITVQNAATGDNLTLPISPLATGEMLKQKLQYIVKLLPSCQRVTYEVDGEMREIGEMETLTSVGISQGSMVTVCDVAEASKVAATLRPPVDGSALQQNIKDKGKNAYYFAHAAPPDVPPEHRFAYGGEPQRIDKPATPEQESQHKRRIEKYSWVDDKSKVKIFIEMDREPDVLNAVKDTEKDVRAIFAPRSLRFTVGAPDAQLQHSLVVTKFAHEINPDKSTWRFSAGKRITISLVKADAAKDWSGLTATEK